MLFIPSTVKQLAFKHDNNLINRTNKREYKPNRDNNTPTIVCIAGIDIRQCVTRGDIWYILEKAIIYQSFMGIVENRDHVKYKRINFREDRTK